MISYEVVVAEIARHVAQAQAVRNEAQMREELSAIRALCDVALHKQGLESSIKAIPKMMTNTIPPLTQKTSVQMPQSLTANKLEEDDANGDSIFDF